MTAEAGKLAAWLEDATTSLHHRFSYGYGGLQGPQNGPAPRPFEARLRLLVEKHFVDALRIASYNADAWLDYDDTDASADLDTLRPSALVVARQGREPVVIGLGWPARGLKTLRLHPPACISPKSVTILLGSADGGEFLTAALSQMIAAAVVSLDGDAAMKAA